MSLLSNYINAQDAHYWNLGYGTRATVLGGTVIGSVTDLSSAFYNPGMLGLKNEPELIVGAKMLEYSTVNMQHPNTERIKLSSSNFRPSPSFIAGSFNSDSSRNNRFSISLLARQYFDFNLKGNLVYKNDNSESGIQDISGEYIFYQEMIETWGGISFGQKVWDNVGIGISQFIGARNQEKRAQVLTNTKSESNEIQTIQRIRSYYYFNIRTLWKIGIGIQEPTYSVGLTFTTPSINLFGSGDAFINDISNNVTIEDSNIPENLMIVNYQEELKSVYKSPWSVGIGGAFRIEKMKFHISAEWFSALEKYQVLATDEFQSQSTGETFTNDLTHETRSILNFGLGAEFNFFDNISGFGSFVLDRSSMKPGSTQNLTVSNYDIYHISTGGILKIGRSEITIGVEYSYGRTIGTNLVGTVFDDVANELEVKYDRYKILFAFLIAL